MPSHKRLVARPPRRGSRNPATTSAMQLHSHSPPSTALEISRLACSDYHVALLRSSKGNLAQAGR
eukprot:6260171-Prymnesium_polylepis.2